MTSCRIVFNYESEADLYERITRFMDRRGYDVTRKQGEMVEIKDLAKEVDRKPGSVSRSLHRASCIPFRAVWGQGTKRRRIVKIERTDELVAFLRERRGNFDPTL